MAEYKFRPLAGPAHLRLLRLLAEPTCSSSHAILEEVPVGKAPVYNALSYVWGNGHPLVPLWIGKERIMIRENLHQALQRLWKMGCTWLWIDAVCVDQSNKEELCQQVMIMRQIYESSVCVIVYLGESAHSAGLVKVFQPMSELAMRYFDTPAIQRTICHDWKHLETQYGLPGPARREWKFLVELAEHAWFERAWTFQEILVARVCLFVRGEWEMPSHNLLLVFLVIYKMNLAPYIDRTEKWDASGLVKAGQRCASIFRRQQCCLTRGLVSLTWERSPLIQLLREAKFSKSTNPCDQIYAYLGISHEAEEQALRPNYNDTPNQTFSRVAHFLVHQGYGPQLLENATSAATPAGMSSWVPRWGETQNENVIFSELELTLVTGQTVTTRHFAAASRTKAAFQLDDTGKVLVGRGIILDSIASIGSSECLVTSLGAVEGGPFGKDGTRLTCRYINEITRMFWNSPHNTTCWETLSKQICCVATCEGQVERGKPSSAQRGLQAFLQLAHNHVEETEMGLSFLRLRLLAYIHPSEDTMENRKLAMEFVGRAYTHYSTFLRCSTGKGYIGQVPKTAQIGDKIAILEGCEIPYLLRSIENDQYTLISNCYVHGIMHGEAWPSHHTSLKEIRIA